MILPLKTMSFPEQWQDIVYCMVVIRYKMGKEWKNALFTCRTPTIFLHVLGETF